MTTDATDQQTRAALLDSQRRVLERIANGAPLREILETLVRLIEEQAHGMRCAVLLADTRQQRLSFAAAPSIPEDYKAGIDSFLRIAPEMGSCGTAAFLRKPVYTRDTATDPLWKGYRDVAVRNGLRAIWSTPILSDDNAVLGTFAMYYGEPRLPLPEHIQLIDMATQMARVAIEAKGSEERTSEKIQALSRQKEDHLRLVIDTIPAMAWSVLPDGTVDFVNQRWLEYTGLSFENALEEANQTVHPEDLPSIMEKWLVDMAAGEPYEGEMRLRRADGEYRWFLNRTVPLRGERGNIVKWYGTATDIEDRKRAADAVRRLAAELQALSRRLVELQESERRQLSRELHDRVGQNLTALKINLDILQTALASQGNDEVRARVDDSAALLESTMDAIENVMSELRPPMFDDHGLAAALDWHARNFSRRTGIAVAVRAHEPAVRPVLQVEIALFRIAQEALNNVAKHARAHRVEIALDHANGECVMSVQDDGIGFKGVEDASDRPKPGLGIVTMRERAQAVGGRFEVQALPGRGTQLTVRVPWLT
jgi:PAS domain S-box-containing protein